MDTLVGVAMVLAPWLLGGLLGWRWGRSWSGTVAAVAVGAGLTLAGLAAFLLTSPASPLEACGEDECVRYFGRWLEASLAREWPLYTALVWAFCAITFSLIRRSHQGTSELPPFGLVLSQVFSPRARIWRLLLLAAAGVFLLGQVGALPEATSANFFLEVTFALASIGLAIELGRFGGRLLGKRGPL